MRAIVLMTAVEKKKAVVKILTDMKDEVKGARLPAEFFKGYSAGYVDALYQSCIINEAQFNYLKRRY